MRSLDWKHHVSEYWEHHKDDTYTRIEDHGLHGGWNIKIALGASSRGANCFENEIDQLIAALQDAKLRLQKCKEEKVS